MRDRERDQEYRWATGTRRSERPAESQRGPYTGNGQIVMGPSFYVWDESPREARDWGVELANAWLMRRR